MKKKKRVVKKAKAKAAKKYKKARVEVTKFKSIKPEDNVEFEELDELDQIEESLQDNNKSQTEESKVETRTEVGSDLDDLDSIEEEPKVTEEKTQEEQSNELDDLDLEETSTQPESSKEPASSISFESHDNSKYDTFYEELKKCSVKLEDEPTFTGINKTIARAQALKDRVSNMLIKAIRNTRKYKRLYEIAFDKRIIDRDEGNQKQREAAVHQVIREQLDNFKIAKDYETVVRQVYDNLISANENVSRQVTVLQEQIKLGEITRPAKGKTGWKNV